MVSAALRPCVLARWLGCSTSPASGQPVCRDSDANSFQDHSSPERPMWMVFGHSGSLVQQRGKGLPRVRRLPHERLQNPNTPSRPVHPNA
eukprot:2915694-Pyramimonas_sp.AAC.1